MMMVVMVVMTMPPMPASRWAAGRVASFQMSYTPWGTF
jgi:hypothetical protein